MCGGWKSESEELIARIHNALTVRGVTREASRAYRHYREAPGSTWPQHEVQEAVRSRRGELKREKQEIARSARDVFR